MFNLKPIVLFSTLSVASLFSTSAMAGPSFNGVLSGLQYTLTDLRPDDGIAPSIGFDYAGASLITNGLLEGATTQFGTQTTAAGQQINSADLAPFNRFKSTASGQFVSIDPVGLSSFGVADVVTNGGLPDSEGDIRAISSASASFNISYTLSAGTKVSFKMNYWLTANGSFNPADGRQDEASIYASLYAGSFNNSDQRHVGVITSSLNPDGWAESSFSVVANNFSLIDRAGYFSASIDGNATDWGKPSISPVPEPESYAMLLAGLGLIGAAVKRRKADQA